MTPFLVNMNIKEEIEQSIQDTLRHEQKAKKHLQVLLDQKVILVYCVNMRRMKEKRKMFLFHPQNE